MQLNNPVTAASLGLGTIATQNANAVAITGGSVATTTGLSFTLNQSAYTSVAANNNSGGTAARAGFSVNTDASVFNWEGFGSGWSPSGGGDDVANGARFIWTGAGGIAWRSSDADGSQRFYVGSTLIFGVESHFGNYLNDAAAAAGGVPVGYLYRTTSALMIRVS